MVGWYHWFSGHELGQTPGDGKEQGSPACCSLWGHRVGHNLATEQQQQKIVYYLFILQICTDNVSEIRMGI